LFVCGINGARVSSSSVRRVAEEGPFESAAEQNIQALSGCEFTRIVTSDRT
jgi:hypothetical protein